MEDRNRIDITGIDRAELLAALHNGTASLGLGAFHDIGRPLTVEEARSDLEVQGRFHFDYHRGRPLKVRIVESEPNVLRGALTYDRDAGPGACQRIVDRLRAGKGGVSQ